MTPRRKYRPAINSRRAKLNADTVQEIRRRYALGESVLQIHASYRVSGITYSGLLQAILGKSWNWIESSPDWQETMRAERQRHVKIQRSKRQRAFDKLASARQIAHNTLVAAWSAANEQQKHGENRVWSDEILRIAHACREGENQLTLQEMADVCGISRERIRQVLRIQYADK